MAVRNLGTLSYSPVIYYRRVAEAVRQLDLKPREILIFLDLSDVHNDAVEYVEVDGKVQTQARTQSRRFKDFLKHNFTTFSVLSKLWLFYHAQVLQPPMSSFAEWTTNSDAFESWGRAGLEANERNMQKIVDQCHDWDCRMTLIVYPWPQQILAGDRDSLQVSHWRKWPAIHAFRFVNPYPPFFALPPDLAVQRHFLAGDIHFSAAGNRLLFDTVWPEIRPAE
jgi:hypothetical protein